AAPVLGEGERKVHGDGCFADASLACSDGDDVLDARQWWTPRLRRRRGTHVRGHPHIDGGDAGQCANRRHRLLTHLILYRTCGRRQLDCERHLTVSERDVFHEAERNDVAAEIRIVDNAQRVEHGVAVERGGHLSILIEADLKVRLYVSL